MLSVASLLNPAPSGPPVHRFPPSPASSSPTTSFADESSFCDRPIMAKHKAAKDAAVFTQGRAKGTVNFYPFERLDEVSMCEVRKYQIYPFGKIQEYCRHIPYNSGKKDFFEKTGRESFEVFQYVFKVPGDDAEYAVMWDYNIGLVRMTPFFKCCKYSKTTPAKMLNMNPGLKEITHSITGGSIMAQGYWMPWHCAKAVCATFCHHIAGALIPIYGPDFPAICVLPEAPDHGRMIIDPSIIIQSTRQASHFRRIYLNAVTSAGSISPKRDRREFRSPYDDTGHHPSHRNRKNLLTSESPYGTNTNGGEVSPASDLNISSQYHYSSGPPVPHLPPGSGWTAANVHPIHYHNNGPNPWLSSVPLFVSTPRPRHAQLPQQHWRGKRPAEDVDMEYDYDARDSRSATNNNSAATSPLVVKTSEALLGAEKSAALLLMNLSVQDRGLKLKRVEGNAIPAESSATTPPTDALFPKTKRLRANSM